MKTRLKHILANGSLWIMFISILITLFWLFIYIVTETFNLRVFNQKTTVFLGVFSVAVIVINVLLAIFSISLNTSIIADLKSGTVAIMDGKQKKKIAMITSSIIIFLTLFLFIGNLITSRIEKKHLIEEAQFIIKNQDKSLSTIGKNLLLGKYREVSKLLYFISSQNREYPSMEVIINSTYNDQDTYIYIDSDFDEEKKIDYSTQFYSGNKKEYQYFEGILLDKDGIKEFLYIDDDDNGNIKIYAPIRTGGHTYILILEKSKRSYGFVGS